MPVSENAGRTGNCMSSHLSLIYNFGNNLEICS